MLANGSSLETVDNLDIEDLRHLYSALKLGLWGPFKDYRQSYFALAKQNEIAELLRATALGKRFKATPFAKYHQLFPTIDAAETLGHGVSARHEHNQQSMALKAAASLGGKVPAWIASEISK